MRAVNLHTWPIITQCGDFHLGPNQNILIRTPKSCYCSSCWVSDAVLKNDFPEMLKSVTITHTMDLKIYDHWSIMLLSLHMSDE